MNKNTELVKDVDLILDLLNQDNFTQYNIALATKIGINGAIMFQALVRMQRLWESQDKLLNGFFYATAPTIQKWTALTERQQAPAVKQLIEMGLIEYEVKGIPAKRYFKIVKDYSALAEILRGNTDTECAKVL